jgi:PTH1 family peptidyl-tRNA hydrolase
MAAFLGNPGLKYARNRHNAGRMLAEAFPFYARLDWQKKFKGRWAAPDREMIISALSAETGLPDPVPVQSPVEKFHFLMPETYMNLSGESVQAAAVFFKIRAEEILLVHDELELPLGTISLKFSGGLGGHNGLRSMKACFGSAAFWRLRIGIDRPGDRLPGEGGPPGSGRGIYEWVLSDFTAAETEILFPALEAGAALLARALISDPEKLLPEWKKKRISSKEK